MWDDVIITIANQRLRHFCFENPILVTKNKCITVYVARNKFWVRSVEKVVAYSLQKFCHRCF
jgi:hypothetical protein